MENFVLLAGLAAVFGLFMAWGIGANDVANAMGTSVGAKALTLKQAILVAAIFEFTGAVLAGGEVTSTIRKGIVDADLLAGNPELLVYGMLASLLAAAIWLFIATSRGWPVSTTHSIVGAVVGFAAVGLGMEAVKWGKVGSIVASWVVSPLSAGFIAFLLFRSVQILILDREDPLRRAKRFVPFYIFLVGFVITLVTMFKGLKHVGLEVSIAGSYAIAVLVGAVVAAIGALFIRRIKEPAVEQEFRFQTVERVFAVLMVCTACSMAFAHGSNDVANAVGPVAAVVSVARTGIVAQQSALPIWVLLIGGIGIVAGLATFGWKVMQTIGERITELTPSRGFAAELAASTTIVVASATGMPVSTT
ncbi:MAG: inorganic phosphate transporter, partial [Xanthomonadales bacterium]|nr:inorganic phosphate transporter [Xanthomonadales bacterium]